MKGNRRSAVIGLKMKRIIMELDEDNLTKRARRLGKDNHPLVGDLMARRQDCGLATPLIEFPNKLAAVSG
jgi:hypothetical protein